MLDGEGIPDTEPLHAFLLACDVAPGQAHEWHHTATRLKIIRARVDERPEHEPFVVWFPQVLRRLRGHLSPWPRWWASPRYDRLKNAYVDTRADLGVTKDLDDRAFLAAMEQHKQVAPALAAVLTAIKATVKGGVGKLRERPQGKQLDRLEALQFPLRARRASPRFELWRHDLRETRETWIHLVDPDGQDPTPEGS